MTPEEPTTLREQLEDAVDQTIQDPTPEVNAPDTWADEDKTIFSSIQDPKARQWLVTRDTDYQSKLTEAQKKYQGFEEVFKPYEERLKTTGQTREQVVTNLLRAQDILEKNPTEGLQQLVKMFGLKPETVLAALGIKAPTQQTDDGTDPNAPEDPYADLSPALAARMRERDKQLELLLSGQKQTQEGQIAQIRQNLASKAREFKETKDDAGQPLYPYMSDQRVVDEMSKLLKAGIVPVEGGDVMTAYKNAYERAVYSFTDLREKLTTQASAAVDQDRVNKARRAGVSPRGAVGASRSTPKVGNSVRDQLRAAAEGTPLDPNA